MRQVDHDPVRVETFHDLVTQRCESAVLRRHRAVAELICRVIGELDHPDAQVGEHVDARRVVTHHGRVLETIDDADLMFRARPQDIGGAINLEQMLRVGP